MINLVSTWSSKHNRSLGRPILVSRVAMRSSSKLDASSDATVAGSSQPQNLGGLDHRLLKIRDSLITARLFSFLQPH
eukprot:142178-Hanusia_phi.AAC.1